MRPAAVAGVKKRKNKNIIEIESATKKESNLPELHVFGEIQYPSLLQEAPTNLKN